MKMFAGVAVALLCAGGASPLSAQGGVAVIPADSVQAFAVVPAGAVDSLVARTRRDTLVLTIRNGARVVIWKAPVARFRHLSDSLAVWCRDLCAPEWDEVYAVPQEVTAYHVGSTWGVAAIHADSAWALGATGRGIIVTALDSGLDPTHPGYTIAGGYNPAGGSWTDDIGVCNGHGTHTGGTMADRTGRGVAPGAVLYGVKVFQLNNGQCLASTSFQIAGLQWAVTNGSRCVNISIGGTITSAAYQNALASAANAGVVISAANGNAGTTPPLFPGRAERVLGTASVGPSLATSSFSNYGPTTDLAGPGEGVESTMPGGGYGTKSGTSMAAPHVAGACALVLSVRPDLTADAVMDLLRATADSLGPRPNDRTGYGLVRPDRAIAALALQGPSVVAAPRTYTTTQTECAAVNGTMPFTATTDATWLTVWTTADRRVCWTADVSRAPSGTTTLPIYLAALAAPITGPIVTVDLATRYQTMSGWEATAQAGQAEPQFLAWQSETLDSGVAIGINRLRVELHSGAENPVDAYARFRAGQITSAQWNAARYVWVNDNADPLSANAAGFSWAKLDEAMSSVVVPFRNKLLAHGDSLYLSLNYVSFGGSTAHADPNEWAELLLTAFQHLQSRYGFVPDAIEVILEPDNNAGTWYGAAIGRAIAAAGPRLAAAGFRPEFIAPSVTNMGNTVPYLDAMVAVPGALTYLKEVSYHRYQGYSPANLQGIATRAKALGLRTSMLEHIASGVDDLLEDVTVGNASAWQQYTLAYPTNDNGAQYLPIIGGRPVTGSLTRLLAPIFSAVKRGAVRVGSASPDYVTAAFVNPDGRAVSVIRSTASGSATIVGLPVGQYSITFTPTSGTPTTSTYYAVGPLPIAFPGAGVTVVRGIP